MSDLIRINSTILSWNSVSVRFDGAPYTGLTAIDFSDKRERKIVHGAKRDGVPLGKTAGRYEVDPITLTMLRDSAQALLLQMTAKGLGSYGDAEFVMSIQYTEPVPTLPTGSPVTVIADRCTIDAVKDTNAEGTDELLTELTLSAIALTRNGLSLYSRIRGLPF